MHLKHWRKKRLCSSVGSLRCFSVLLTQFWLVLSEHFEEHLLGKLTSSITPKLDFSRFIKPLWDYCLFDLLFDCRVLKQDIEKSDLDCRVLKRDIEKSDHSSTYFLVVTGGNIGSFKCELGIFECSNPDDVQILQVASSDFGERILLPPTKQRFTVCIGCLTHRRAHRVYDWWRQGGFVK